jgi:hypothetical protein
MYIYYHSQILSDPIFTNENQIASRGSNNSNGMQEGMRRLWKALTDHNDFETYNRINPKNYTNGISSPGGPDPAEACVQQHMSFVGYIWMYISDGAKQ